MDKLMTERLEALMTRYNQIQEDLQNDEVIANLKKYTELSRESRQLEPTFLAYSSYKNAIQTIEDAKILLLEDDEEMSGSFYITKTKETYVYEDEADADEKVDAVRRDNGFAGVEKKYKAGKMNKAGEVVKPEIWTVVAKLNK